jgi:endonuclease/exonuclease/phosphatase family metal-dependent hydrolase
MIALSRSILCWLCLLHLATAETYTICHWNLENFGVTDRFIDNQRVKAAMKPEKEINAEMKILKRINPDILGVCEVLQDPDQKYLKLLKQRLKEAGLDYPYLSTALGDDSRIQTVLFSRFPIAKDEPLTQETYKATVQGTNGTTQEITKRPGRAILNCLIQVNDKTAVRVLYAHLKSKRAYPEIISDEKDEAGDTYVRRNEALIMKNAALRALQANPQEKLIMMGDFNDTPKSRTFKTILGLKDATVRMYDLWLKDYFGDMWTHYYIPENEYSRIDYMVVSEPLFHDWIAEKSYLYRCNQNDPEEFSHYTASDHRPLVAVFEADDGTPRKPRHKKERTAETNPEPDSVNPLENNKTQESNDKKNQ